MAKGLGSYIRVADKKFIQSIEMCMYCGSYDNLHIDHIVPPKIGGDSRRSNLTRACNKCNARKSDLTIERFLENCINRRDEHFARAIKYARRYRKALKNDDLLDMDYCYDKFDYSRNEYKYFKTVIKSIKEKRYIVYG